MRPEELSIVGRWSGITAPAVDFWLQKWNPTWSLGECLAEVRSINEECPGVKTLTLRANRKWAGFTPGQHVQVSLQVDGRWLKRTWTISSSNVDTSRLTLTISKIEGGRATSWIHDQLRPGAVVKLSAAQGDFVLPSNGEPVVFLAGGAGLTPALSMLRSMRDRKDQRRFELVHFIRSNRYAIAKDELRAIAATLPNVTIHWVETHDGDPAREQRISESILHNLALDQGVENATWMLCGPEGFMDAATAIIRKQHPSATIASERFAPPSMRNAQGGGTVHFARTQGEAPNASTDNLLSAVEASGRNPKFGCRAGTCFECVCLKKSGTVLDLRTGELLDEENQQIQLCITQAVGDVTLDL